MAWYYNRANDRRRDGCRREYCDEPKWKYLDPAVWNALKELPERSVDALESWESGPHRRIFTCPSSGPKEAVSHGSRI